MTVAGGGLFTVKVIGVEAEPPGLADDNVRISCNGNGASRNRAINSVELMKVVGTLCRLNVTCDP